MASVSEAIDALRASLQKKCVESRVQDAFDSLASCLVLLNSSSASVQMIQKLRSVLRRSFLPLFNTCFQPALQLSSRILSVVLSKLGDAHIIENEVLRAEWDGTAEDILSGVLDFLEKKDAADAESSGTSWEVLYRIICEFFFLDSGRGLSTSFSTTLCLAACNTLAEIAAGQATARNALRQRNVLGGERLGAAISGTRDYLLLEALLVLFARLLPAIHATSQGKSKRFKFVKEVLGSPKLFKCNAELLDVMRKMSVTHWDDVAAKIIDVLAKTDITYPQPFSIDEIHVCGRVFPQPLATDRLIMDKHTFLANIVAENNDSCESLQVPYSRVRTITLDNSEKNVPKGKVSIMVYLSSAPLIAKVEMKCAGANTLHAKFLLQSDVVARFMEALRRRGVGKLSFLNSLSKADGKRRNISIGLGLQFTNDSSPIPPTANFEGKVQHVNEVYKTGSEDLTMHDAPVSHTREKISSLTIDAKSPFKDRVLVPTTLEPAVAEDALATPQNNRLTPPINERPKPLRNSATLFLSEESRRKVPPFDDIDELSELSDIESDSSATKKSKISASCSHAMELVRDRTGHIRMNAKSNVAFNGSMKSSKPTPKDPERRERVTQRTLEASKPLVTSDSSMFGPSSSTQIDISPKLPSNADTHLTTVDSEVINDLSGASLVLIDPDDGYNVFEKELGTKIKKSQKSLQLREGKLGLEQARRLVPTSATDRKGHSPIDLTKDSNIAGNRRKREYTRISSESVIEVSDEYSPPRKKRREDRPAIEDNLVESNEPLFDSIPRSRVKDTRTAECSSRCVVPTAINLDELKPALQRCRRSSRIRKRRATPTAGGRNNAIRGKVQEGKQPGGRLGCGDEGQKSTNVSLQDARGKVGGKSLNISSPILPIVGDSFVTKIDDEAPAAQPRMTRGVSPEAFLPREVPKGGDDPARAPSQHTFASDKVIESRENPDCVHELVHVSVAQGQSLVQIEEAIMDTEGSQLPEIDGYLVSSKGRKEPSPLIMESTPRKERITIDLTVDESPPRGQGELRRATVAPVHPETNVQAKLGTPEHLKSIDTVPSASVPTSRCRARSVTFASPVGYVLDNKVKSRANISSPRLVVRSSLVATRKTVTWTPISSTSHSAPPPEGNILSPLRIPKRAAGMKRELSGPVATRLLLQNPKRLEVNVPLPYHNGLACRHTKASEPVPDHNGDNVDIQDIVEVLNEIQAVIIKGISNKFGNVKKHVQHSRDELIQQVLGELRGMVIENATYFNGLLRLEEDYHRQCNALTRHWEELIDCNDNLAVQFQNALTEHDKNVTARVFPKSLVTLQPVFSIRRVNA